MLCIMASHHSCSMVGWEFILLRPRSNLQEDHYTVHRMQRF